MTVTELAALDGRVEISRASLGILVATGMAVLAVVGQAKRDGSKAPGVERMVILAASVAEANLALEGYLG